MTKAMRRKSDSVEEVHSENHTGFAFAQEPGQLEAMRVTTIRVLKENGSETRIANWLL